MDNKKGRVTKRRAEMGEEAWAEYQKQRRCKKVIRWRRNKKLKLIAYKGGKCEICGYDKPYYGVYDFHHKDPTKKEFGLAANGKCRSFEKMKKEADKCILLCKNCHSELHENEWKKSSE